ncbi:MAG: hypothetical protein QN183_11955 [Armatimonadota bacterium]|nr:hypothetical protein [Armatimonadota bacterium]MDR7537063.1 hypothetical protein [Armatimonadota bacterium]
MTARSGITHYAWPGGLAVVLETPTAGIGAVFGAAGWQLAPHDAVTAGLPSGAARAHLPLPEDVVAQCMDLEFVGGALHTDFVLLDRLLRRLQADGTSAVLFVLGTHPAAFVVSEGTLTAFDPTAPEASEEAVITRAAGWIVQLAGRMRAPATPPEPAMPVAAPAPAGATAVASPDDERFGRFAASARFLCAPGADAALAPELRAAIQTATGVDPGAVVRYLDGGHTLAEVAAASGLRGPQVAAVLEVLVARRLAFRYVSRSRPQTGSRLR